MGGVSDRDRDDDMPDLDPGGASYGDAEDIQPIEDDGKAGGGEEEDLEDMLLETMFDDDQEEEKWLPSDEKEKGHVSDEKEKGHVSDEKEKGHGSDEKEDEDERGRHNDMVEDQERPTGVMVDDKDEPSTAQGNVMPTFESLPRSPDGTIDVEALTMEQRKLYNAQVMSLLTENQMDRYECFRRSSLKEPMRKLIQVIVGGGNPKSTDKIVIAMAGVTKVYVGEIIEHARKIAESRGERGPLTPEMIYEAYTIVSSRSRVESSTPKTRTMRL